MYNLSAVVNGTSSNGSGILTSWLNNYEDKYIDSVTAKDDIKIMNNKLEDMENYQFQQFLLDMSVYAQGQNVYFDGNTLSNDYNSVSVDNDSEFRVLKFVVDSASLGSSWKVPDFGYIGIEMFSEMKDEIEKIAYVGPIRESLERVNILRNQGSTEVGKAGGMVPNLLFQRPDLLMNMNKVFEDFDIPYEIKVSHHQDVHFENVFTLRLIEKSTKTNMTFLDVGFGISQVLPVLVQTVLSSGNIVAIEQPEVHLHPKLQAQLATLFVDSYKHRGNQFIIETHSEHLILRLQRLIREGRGKSDGLKPDDVSVLYVTRNENGSRCQQLRLNEYGDFIDPWPGGFFEEAFEETFAGYLDDLKVKVEE